MTALNGLSASTHAAESKSLFSNYCAALVVFVLLLSVFRLKPRGSDERAGCVGQITSYWY